MPPLEEKVEFQTNDGTTLRGSLYPASGRGPGIVMSPGKRLWRRRRGPEGHQQQQQQWLSLISSQFNCVKEMLGLPDVAQHFQQAGITALVYDPRSTGVSDGTPRNDINPIKQVEDYSDALTYLSGHPAVDPSRLAFWGMSFSATVALCAASLDKRASLVIAICPLTDFTYTAEKLPEVMARCMRDRESQLTGSPPLYLPMLNSRGENPAGFGIGIDREQYGQIVNAGREIAPNHVNRTTIQSYYHMIMWQPFSLWRLLDPTPVMFVVPELDRLSPADVQLGHFDALTGPKRLRLEPGVGHMEILQGPHLPGLVDRQVAFLTQVLEGALESGGKDHAI